MTNAELIAKIKAEINYRIETYIGNAQSCVGTTLVDGLEEVLDFLSTLEEEKPMNQEGLEEEINRFRTIFKNECDACIIGEIANHFAQWGAEQFAKIVRENITEISEDAQKQFEQLYFKITNEKMYGGYND